MQDHDTTPVARSETALRITGRVETELALSWPDLATMDQVEASDVAMICGDGEPLGQIGQCRGVLLRDIVNRAAVVIEGHYDTRRMYLVARADDGYKVVFSWQEVFNSPVGEGLLVLLQREGRSVSALEMLSMGDYLTGPRHVRHLAVIDILMVE